MAHNFIQNENDFPVLNAKELVDGMRACLKSLHGAATSKKVKQGGSAVCNPNIFFDVLRSLSIVPGYALQFVYHKQDCGSEPRLYFWRKDIPPLQFYSQYASWNSRHQLIDYLVADGTPQSYFELLAFHIMSSQFAQEWHACYNDQAILVSMDEVEDLITRRSVESGGASKFTASQVAAMRALAVQPHVEIAGSEASVFYCVFSNWGGVSMKSTTFKRTPPHKLLGEETIDKVSYNCGILY